MRKKHVKVNFGNLILLLIIIGAVSYGIYFMYNKLQAKPNDSNDNKENVSELVKLGYSKEEAKEIESNMKDDEIKKIDKKYENLAKYSKVKYFHIENIDRYDKLLNNSSYDIEEVIMRVNTGIDQDFYTNVNTVNNVDDLLVLVNKYNMLPEDFKPKNLINVGNGQEMQKEAGEALLKMIDDIKSTGLHLQAQSGYRSISTQKTLYDRRVQNYGKEAADQVQARPGYSEHHTGLAIDVSHDGTLEKTFENTDQFKWLQNNAYKFGFILRYPSDKIYMTGYDYEPWHYRYVGVEAATIIHNENITYEEYAVKYLGLY